MRNILIASTFAIAAIAGAANASSTLVATGPGDAQLALSAGVQPGQYSRSELLNIIAAQRENDQRAVNFYLSGANRSEGQVAPEVLAQLEAQAGPQGAGLTPVELQQLLDAQRENAPATVAYILGKAGAAGSVTVANAGGAHEGKAMLAALAGVNPDGYSLADLVALQPQADN